MRVARSPEGIATVDPTGPDSRPMSQRGRGAGRGAYVCPREACIERAFISGGLRRALRYEGELPHEVRTELLRRAKKGVDGQAEGS
ncbi:MAG: YlxR family protein [Actinomycetota bacterium]|nr:YlxR family protein [Actinomycetota bacterium]